MDNNPDIRQLVHDARNPLNRVSMQAELAKMLLEKNSDHQKILEVLDSIISGCQECSLILQTISDSQK